MNIVFFGSSNFAVPSLKALIATGQKISCVVTQPDKKKGRGLSLASTEVKSIGLEFGLSVYQPEKVNSPEAIRFLKGLAADLFIVISYGQILSQEILDIPRIFSINVHGSLLPKYRGAAPINWAIINGEKTSGITIIKMVKEMDAGPIILQQKVDINEDDTSIILQEKLSRIATELLPDVIRSIENGNYNLIPQDKNEVSFAPKLKKEDGLICWNKPAQDIYNLIRGCFGWPGAFTYYNGKLLKIYRAMVTTSPRHHGILRQAQDTSPKDTERSRSATSPGEIVEVSKEGIVVATQKDCLVIKELQLQGKRRLGIEEFISGHKISIGEVLRKK